MLQWCSVLSAGVRCLCAVNQEAVQTGGATSPHQAKSSLCTHPTALCSAFPSPLSPHVPDTRHTAFNHGSDISFTQARNTGWTLNVVQRYTDYLITIVYVLLRYNRVKPFFNKISYLFWLDSTENLFFYVSENIHFVMFLYSLSHDCNKIILQSALSFFLSLCRQWLPFLDFLCYSHPVSHSKPK